MNEQSKTKEIIELPGVNRLMLHTASYLLFFIFQEYHKLEALDVYSQIVFNHTTDEVTKFEVQRRKPAFTPTWILKITWNHTMPVSFQNINTSEVESIQIMQTFQCRS